MKKKLTAMVLCAVILCITGLVIYPSVEFRAGGKLYACSYNSDFSPWEENLCLSERHSYDEKRDISICGWELKEFLFFKVFVLDYVAGNVCATEYMLPELYIQQIIDDGQIVDNPGNIDLAQLISGKTAVVSNTRYTGNDYETQMTYALNGRHEILYVFETDGLLVIQVGLSDEGPRFIAYK